LGTSSVSGKELAERPELARLRSLEVKGDFAAAEGQTILESAHLEHLVALALPEGDSAVLTALVKHGPRTLAELNLSGMVGFPRQLGRLTGKVPFALKKLNLAGTLLDAQHCAQLAEAPSLASLTHLDLVNNSGLRVAGAEALAKSPHLTNLTSLALGRSNSAAAGCQIGLKGTQALAASPTLANLETLDVRDNNLADSAVAAIVASPHWKLKELWLGSNKITTKGIETLVNWPGLEQMRLLHFWVNYGIKDEGAKLLAQAPGVANLLHLDLGYTTLSPKGALALAQSPHLRRLRHLNVEGNKIGDAGVITLVKSPVVASLRGLNLARTEMKDSAARAIIDSPHLQHLRTLKLNGTKLTNPTKKALEERFGPGVCQFGQQ
jgi:Leucine-rich repeat (LRR) protein